eukprot:945054-Pelagomonas_calceolata.AAC.1
MHNQGSFYRRSAPLVIGQVLTKFTPQNEIENYAGSGNYYPYIKSRKGDSPCVGNIGSEEL